MQFLSPTAGIAAYLKGPIFKISLRFYLIGVIDYVDIAVIKNNYRSSDKYFGEKDWVLITADGSSASGLLRFIRLYINTQSFSPKYLSETVYI